MVSKKWKKEVQQDKATGTILVERVPRKILRKFKAACAVRGTSMRDVLITYMWHFPNEEVLEKEEKLTMGVETL